jgi:hypothetical protein
MTNKLPKSTEHGWLFLSILVMLVAFAFLGLWSIDISVSVMLVGAAMGDSVYLTNGFWITNPGQLYHVGLWLLSISVICLALLAGYFIQVNFRKKVIEEHDVEHP